MKGKHFFFLPEKEKRIIALTRERQGGREEERVKEYLSVQEEEKLKGSGRVNVFLKMYKIM